MAVEKCEQKVYQILNTDQQEYMNTAVGILGEGKIPKKLEAPQMPYGLSPEGKSIFVRPDGHCLSLGGVNLRDIPENIRVQVTEADIKAEIKRREQAHEIARLFRERVRWPD